MGKKTANGNGTKVSAIWVCEHKDPDVKETLGRYVQALSSLPYTVDLTVVGNGASPVTSTMLRSQMNGARIPSRIVSLHRGCDEATAIQVGLRASDGDLVVLLPPYLQVDPEALPRMIDEVERGADYVASWRTPRVDAKWRQFISSMFNALTCRVTKVRLHDLNSGLRVMRRQLARSVPIYGDMLRFWPVLAALQGYRVEEVKARHLRENVARGDYRIGMWMRRILDILTLFFLIKFTHKPLRFFGLIGSATFAMGAAITGVLAVQRILGSALADRPMLILGILLIVLGIQLFSVGLLGELIIFTHGKKLRDDHVETIYEARRDV